MALTWVGYNSEFVGGSTSGSRSLAVPTGTALGHWMLIVGIGVNSWTCTDSRFTKISDLDVPGGDGWGEAWFGEATSLADITYTYNSVTSGGPFGNMTALVGTIANEPNPRRVSAPWAETVDEFTMPGVSGRGVGGVALTVGVHGLGSSAWNAPTGWTKRFQDGTYYVAALATTDQDVVTGGASHWSYESGTTRHAGVVIGVEGFINVAPPARLFPRSDGLGVGSGRHFPPPKSQQRSGRNFGYY